MRRTHIVAVYGTLMRGEPNHGLLAGSRFLGRGRVSGMRMHDAGAFPVCVPAMERPDESCIVVVETFAVDGRTLRRLDELEGTPWLYRRLRVDVRCACRPWRAWLYVAGPRFPTARLPLIESGDWRRHCRRIGKGD